MKLNQLSDNPGARKNRIRVGRGIGSGKGKTAGRGGKGQTARSGVAIKGHEGGQMPLFRRLPKRGFNNIFRLRYVVVNLGQLQKAVEEKRLDASGTIDVAALQKAGILNNPRDGIKLLGKGELKSKVTIEVAGASKSAIGLVEKLGGSVIVKASKPRAEEAAEDGKSKAGAKPKREAKAEPKTEPAAKAEPKAAPAAKAEGKPRAEAKAKSEGKPKAETKAGAKAKD